MIIATLTRNGYTITLDAEAQDYGMRFILIAETQEGNYFTSASTQDWTELGKALPRSQWPLPIFAGKKHQHRENVPAEFTQAIQAAIEAEVATASTDRGIRGEADKIVAVWIDEYGEIILDRDGLVMSFADYDDMLDEMED